jgi:multidrug efflux pump subunit AcrB
LSILIGVTGLYLAGFSINQLSIVGGVIALGLLVDDSIVVVENISRWVRGGTRPFDAAIQATSQIGPAVLGCTATLILAFLPLMFLPGMAGKYIRVLPSSVTFIVLGSLLVALTIIPFIASKVLKPSMDPEGNRILKGLNKGIDFTYGRALQWALKNTVMTVTIAGILFFSSLLIVNLIGFSLFPKAGLPQFFITVETPRGSTLDETDRAVRYVESVLSKQPEVKYYMSNIGKGNPMIYYNSFQKSEQSALGEVLCEIDYKSLPHIEQFIGKLKDTLDKYVNARIFIYEFENGQPVDAPIAMRLTGENLDSLQLYSEKIEDIIRKTPGTTYIKNPLSQSLTDIKVAINLKPALTPEQLDKRIQKDFLNYSRKQFKNSLDELLPQKLIPVIIRLSGIDGDKPVNSITKEERLHLVNILREFTFNIKDTRPINEAIVTAGGVSVKEVDPASMESKIVKGLYFTGEVLDVDALTGGFNLQIAFSTGYCAGLYC